MTAQNVFYCPQLSSSQIDALQKLIAQGQASGIHYKVDPGTSDGILLTRGQVLTGFMTTDFFGGEAMESAAIASCTSDWAAMNDILLAEARKRSIEELLYIVDSQDHLISAHLNTLGRSHAFSEYRMQLDPSAFSPAEATAVSLAPATFEDRAFIAALDTESFDQQSEPSPTLPEDNHIGTELILHDGAAIGKLRVIEATEESRGTAKVHGLYGIVITPELRGKGLGAQALSLLLRRLLDAGSRRIYLEVDSDNHGAYHLYHKLGFKKTAEFKYYSYMI